MTDQERIEAALDVIHRGAVFRSLDALEHKRKNPPTPTGEADAEGLALGEEDG